MTQKMNLNLTLGIKLANNPFWKSSIIVDRPKKSPKILLLDNAQISDTRLSIISMKNINNSIKIKYNKKKPKEKNFHKKKTKS